MYKEIQSGAVAKSYMRKGFLIHTVYCMRRPPLVIYDCNNSILDFLIFEENLIFFTSAMRRHRSALPATQREDRVRES
jgi:hypothetical protein